MGGMCMKASSHSRTAIARKARNMFCRFLRTAGSLEFRSPADLCVGPMNSLRFMASMSSAIINRDASGD